MKQQLSVINIDNMKSVVKKHTSLKRKENRETFENLTLDLLCGNINIIDRFK